MKTKGTFNFYHVLQTTMIHSDLLALLSTKIQDLVVNLQTEGQVFAVL